MKKAVSILLAVIMIFSLSAFPVFAVDDSVTAPPAPEIIPVEGDVAAILYTADGEALEVPDGAVIVTPVAVAQEAGDTEIAQQLVEAYEQILQSGASALVAFGGEITMDDLVVHDLFDVTLTGQYADLFEQEGASLKLTFKVNVAPGETVAVMTNCPGVGWKLIDPRYVVNNGDGTITVTFHELCPVAILTRASKSPADMENPEVTSPQTGDNGASPLWLWAALFAMAAVVCGALAAKKRALGK